MQRGRVSPIPAQIEADPGQEHFVDEALEDRRKAHVPDRKGKDEGVSLEQPVHVGGDAAPVYGPIVIVDAVLAGHDRIEPFGIEVAIVDCVAARTQGLDDGRVQAGGEAGLDRMGEQDQHAQNGSPFITLSFR